MTEPAPDDIGAPPSPLPRAKAAERIDRVGSLSRRSLLVGAAGVGAAAWVAPSILTVDAAAAATCLKFVYPFGQFGDDIGLLSNDSPTLLLADPIDLLLTYSSTQPDGPARVRYAPGTSGTKSTDFIQFELSNNDYHGILGEFVELRFQFLVQGTSDPLLVRNLSFSLLDVDQSPGGGAGGGQWRDLVEVQAYAGSSFVPASVTPSSPADVVHQLLSSPPRDQVKPTPQALEVPDNSTAGNVDFSYTSPVDTLYVRFIVDDGPEAQQIGLWRLSGCTT